MSQTPSLDELWNSAQPGTEPFGPTHLSGLPEGAQRYLEHAISPGTLLASAVRLRMHGEIKLRRWRPFQAEQVIHHHRGMIWSARVRMNGLPVYGSDRIVDREGSMLWKLLRIFPLVKTSGFDVTRSATGRLAAESIWLPSRFCGDEVLWSGDSSAPRAEFLVQGQLIALDLAIENDGRIEGVQLSRWGQPEGGEFRYEDFGGIVEKERTFGGYTIPSRIRVGWYFGAERFDTEGEFFRVTIDEAEFR
ncbi:MAG: DUF6544 family protein [Opitutales bacterium]